MDLNSEFCNEEISIRVQKISQGMYYIVNATFNFYFSEKRVLRQVQCKAKYGKAWIYSMEGEALLCRNYENLNNVYNYSKNLITQNTSNTCSHETNQITCNHGTEYESYKILSSIWY